jgi:hypothetical protein
VPIRPIASRAGRNFVFPPVLHFWTPPFCIFFLFYRVDAVAMANNNTPYFRIAVKFSRLSLSVRHPLPQALLLFGTFLPEALSRATLVRRITVSVPIRPIASRAGRNFVFPPVLHFWTPPFCIRVSYCRGDAVATVNNNTPYFAMTATFSRPKCRKSDGGGDCLEALRGV